MKTKIFSLLLAVAAGVGTMFAWDYEDVQIGDLYYNLNATNKTAGVARNSSASGSILIPASVEYNSVTYSVTSIGGFDNCSGLTSVTIPSSVTSIGWRAFDNCSGLTSVTIPSSVTSIGVEAFNGCSGLTSIIVESGNTVYDSRNNCNAIIETATNTLIAGCQSTIIPNSVTSIGFYAFGKCSSLTSVTIPNSVTSIGEWAFSYCSGLTSVTIPNSVTSIGEWAFGVCTCLTSVTAPAIIFDKEESSWSGYTHSLQTVTFTSGELTYNVLGILARSYQSLTYLDVSAVSNTALDDEAFKGFYNLQTLKLPAGLTSIGYMAVADCKNLQSINIPASVTEISQSAFENCRSLKSITFGESSNPVPGRHNAPAASTSQLQRIGNWAFYNCHELQNLTIPEGVTEIGDGAFYGCVYLEDLSLPSSVQSIGDNTFALCAKLEKIVVNAVVPPSIQAKTFYDVQRQIPVYVPDECVTAYKSDAQWSEFNIQGLSNMPQGIDQITNDNWQMTNKIIKDGQVFILRGDKTYTLTGQEVK